MSLVQEFESEITCVFQEELYDLTDEENFIEMAVELVMSIADDLGLFRGTN